MLKSIYLPILSLFSFFLTAQTLTTQPEKKNNLQINVAISEGTYKSHAKYLRGDICEKLPNYSIPNINRPLAELFIICLAFKEQNIDVDIKLIPVSNYLRAVQIVKTGHAHTIAESIWRLDIGELNVYSTVDVIREGEFEKGIYAYNKNPILTIPAADIDFNEYTGITFKSWIHDWAIMQALTKKRKETAHLPSLFQILKANRADFTLMEFSYNARVKNTEKKYRKGLSSSLSIWKDGIKLTPVIGLKVKIPDSRRFIVSKTANNADFVFSAINKGLMALRQKKRIASIYKSADVISSVTKDWKVIDLDPEKIKQNAKKQKKNNDKYF